MISKLSIDRPAGSPSSAFQLIFATLLLLHGVLAQAAGFDHAAWDALLKKHVVALRSGELSQVDYAGMAADRSQLKQYLNSVSGVKRAEFERWSKAEQLAFLINAYNATTVDLVLTAYPDIASIRDLGSLLRSPWKRPVILLLDQMRSLDDIEHGLIRGSGRYNDPRIHFAVNCASIGCPALRPEAYAAERLDAQLEDAAQKFLSDRTRNRFDGNAVKVSSIFNWYRDDFEKGWRGARTRAQFLALYHRSLGMDGASAGRLANGAIAIEFLDYDWRLNAAPRPIP